MQVKPIRPARSMDSKPGRNDQASTERTAREEFMADNMSRPIAMVVESGGQSPSQATNADVARALQDAATAREQARAAELQARAQQNEAQAELREAQREIEQAKKELEQTIRQEIEGALGRGRGAEVQVPFPPPFPGGPQIPEGAVVIAVAFFVMCAVIAVGLPIARAFSRRMDRRHAATPAADSETHNRLDRIEHAVDAIAIEVERISEGQRFTTKILGEMRALPQPDPSVAVPDRVAVPISRAREAR
jgi:multidrug efflux pump subunit AcrA (membrane-fusion protein)